MTDSAALDANLAKLRPILDRIAATGVMNRIGGQDRPASDGATFANHSPVDESLICQVARGTAADIDAAAAAAKAAFPAWRDMEAVARKKILHRIADGIVARAEEIALANAGTPGRRCASCPRRRCAGPKISASSPIKALSARDGQHLPSPTLMNITTRVPIGPVGVITPWNTPFMLSTWKIAPALAAGCTVVHKPAEFSPVTARILLEIAEEAGLPPGVLEPCERVGRRGGPRPDRASRYQGDCLCRREQNRRR